MCQKPIFPKHLKSGDTIRIISPSRSITSEEILPVTKWLNTKGFKVEYGENINRVCGQFGGDDNQRIEEFQQAINNPSVRAIWCARGGYGAARIIDKINFEPLLCDPKWIIGFSDITAIHCALFRLGLVSLHAQMPINFRNEVETKNSFDLLVSYLTGVYLPVTWLPSSDDKTGSAEGKLFGGNLSVLYSLRGTQYDIDTAKTIFFIEDIDEYLYHIDRMCNNMNMSNKFSFLSGFISGQFTKMNDNQIPFGKNAREILLQYTTNVPVQTYDAPVGHIPCNLPMLYGALATLEVQKTKVTLSYNGTA
jgi:muramoyltetrapeptide carboxypeptidase